MIESSFSTLTANVASIERQTKVFVADTECEGERGHGFSLPEVQNGGVPFLDCNLRFGDNRYMEGGGEGWGARFLAA